MTPTSSSNRPTRKVGAGALGGALATIVVWAVSLAGVDVPGTVGAAIGVVFTFGTSFLVPEGDES